MLYLNSILLPKVKCGAEFSEGKYLPKRFALANNEQRNDDITYIKWAWLIFHLVLFWMEKRTITRCFFDFIFAQVAIGIIRFLKVTDSKLS